MISDPHHNEYLAAAAGMRETYGEPTPPDPFANIAGDDGAALDAFCGHCRSLPAIGDFVSGCTAGRRWSGHVMTAEPGRISVECGGAWIVVDPADITH